MRERWRFNPSLPFDGLAGAADGNLWGQLGWTDPGDSSADPQVSAGTVPASVSFLYGAQNATGVSALNLASAFTITAVVSAPTPLNGNSGIFLEIGPATGTYIYAHFVPSHTALHPSRVTVEVTDSAGASYSQTVDGVNFAAPLTLTLACDGTTATASVNGAPVTTGATLDPTATTPPTVYFSLDSPTNAANMTLTAIRLSQP
jgi:hypothetical protein